MKRGFPILPVLFLGAWISAHAFTPDIAGDGVAESGQGPRSIFVPGYGEVAFESPLDGVLVVDSAYASTDRINVPPPSGDAAAEPTSDNTAAGEEPGFVKITNRNVSEPPVHLHAAVHPVDDVIQTPPGTWNAVPEAASATLGLIGTLMLLLRRRMKSASGVS
jgi:hypothetical protein